MPSGCYTLEMFAELATDEGQPERAARLWGAEERLWKAIGAGMNAHEREEHDSIIAEARAQIAPELFEAAWAAGRNLTTEQALAYAERS